MQHAAAQIVGNFIDQYGMYMFMYIRRQYKYTTYTCMFMSTDSVYTCTKEMNSGLTKLNTDEQKTYAKALIQPDFQTCKCT